MRARVHSMAATAVGVEVSMRHAAAGGVVVVAPDPDRPGLAQPRHDRVRIGAVADESPSCQMRPPSRSSRARLPAPGGWSGCRTGPRSACAGAYSGRRRRAAGSRGNSRRRLRHLLDDRQNVVLEPRHRHGLDGGDPAAELPHGPLGCRPAPSSTGRRFQATSSPPGAAAAAPARPAPSGPPRPGPPPPASGRDGAGRRPASPPGPPRPRRDRPTPTAVDGRAGSGPSWRSTRPAAPAAPAGPRPGASRGSRRRCRVHELVDAGPPQERHGRQAVEDVLAGDRLRLADAAQVDRLRSRPAAAGRGRRSPPSCAGVACHPERRSLAGPRRTGLPVCRRGAASRSRNARRERIAIRRWGHRGLPFLTVAPLPASALLAPGVPRSSRVGPVFGRVSPAPRERGYPLTVRSSGADVGQ